MAIDPPPAPERPGLGINVGDGDFLSFVVCLLRRFRSPSRNF